MWPRRDEWATNIDLEKPVLTSEIHDGYVYWTSRMWAVFETAKPRELSKGNTRHSITWLSIPINVDDKM